MTEKKARNNTDQCHCPLCQSEVPQVPRYPDYICDTCASGEIIDAEGHVLEFYNEGFWGGFVVMTYEDGELLDKDNTLLYKICYVKGVKCKAREARFGGIVIQKVEDET